MPHLTPAAHIGTLLLGLWSGTALAQGLFDLDQMHREMYGLGLGNCQYAEINKPGDMTPEKRIEVCSAVISKWRGQIPGTRPAGLAADMADIAADETATAYDARAHAYYALGQHDKALLDMQDAVALIENYFLANKRDTTRLAISKYYLDRGIAFSNLGQFAKANDDFMTCLRREPGKYTEACIKNIKRTSALLKSSGTFDKTSLHEPVIILQKEGAQRGQKRDYKEALDYFNLALDLASAADDPNLEAYLLYFRGGTFWRLKDNARAAADLNRCLTLSTNAETISRCRDALSKL